MSILDNNQMGDKRTLIAVVLSVVVITVGFLLQATLFPPAPAPVKTAQSSVKAAVPVENPQTVPTASTIAPDSLIASTGSTTGTSIRTASSQAGDAPVTEREYTISTDLLEAVLTNKGGDLVSLKLKKHSDKDGEVDLVVPSQNGKQGLSLAFGDSGALPVADFMNAVVLSNSTIAFTRTFLASVPGKDLPVPFTLKKTYTFRDGSTCSNSPSASRIR